MYTVAFMDFEDIQPVVMNTYSPIAAKRLLNLILCRWMYMEDTEEDCSLRSLKMITVAEANSYSSVVYVPEEGFFWQVSEPLGWSSDQEGLREDGYE